MLKTVFITSTEAHSGKSIISIGLVNMLLGKAQKIGYYKPIIDQNQPQHRDDHIDTILTHFDLPMAYEDTYAFTWQEAMTKIDTESQGEMIDTIIRKFKRLDEQYDFTVVEGTDYQGEGAVFEFDLQSDFSIADDYLGVRKVFFQDQELFEARRSVPSHPLSFNDQVLLVVLVT